MHELRPRVLAAAMLLSSAIVSHPAHGQLGLPFLDDASTPPRGLLRFRAAQAWTRFDSRFTGSGVSPLGAYLTSDSLGPRQVPQLASIQSLVQSASASPFLLTLGRARFDATGREEIIPFAFEYGVTNRFAVGVTIPIVRRRVAAVFVLDSAGAQPNVGPNPQRSSSQAAQTNALVQAEFSSAAAQLQGRLTACQQNPGGPGCGALLARQAEAVALIQSSTSFASDVAALYGATGLSGMAFVPLKQSAAQDAIALRVSDFNTRYRDLLGSSANLISAVPFAAAGPAGAVNFQQYYVNELGRDSLTHSERIGIGDVELGLKFRLIDRPVTDSGALGIQVALASAVRWPTGSRQSNSDIADLSTSEGSVIVDSKAIADLRMGRLGFLALGEFASRVHDVDTSALATRNARWTEVQLAPRWHLSRPFAIHAAYALRATDKMGSDQLVGGGMSYSTLAEHAATGRNPIEMRYTHLEAINGAAGRPKFFREQIELRIYFRLR